MLVLFFNFIFENVLMVGFVGGTSSFPPKLTKEEEEKYLAAYENGDTEAKNILIEHNLRLVAHVVKKYQGSGIESDDLISIGTIGLIKAITTYKPDKKIRLATYAARCIENEVLMVLRSSKKLHNEFSINEPIGYDKEGNEVNLLDVLQEEDDDIIERLEYKSRVKSLYCALANLLQKREAQVIEKRYGLRGQRAKTQREIAKELGISRSYVSRIEKKAVKKLKEGLMQTY